MTAINFHTHTYRCRHATGDVIDYAKAALRQGCTELGISDHVPFPDDRWLDVRMSFDQLDHYEQAIASARRKLPQIKIHKGMECEYDTAFHSYLEDELLGERHYDYLIGAGHYTPLNGNWLNSFAELDTPEALVAYAKYLVQMMETGLFAFIAHPDIFGCSNESWNADLEACSRDILQAAQGTATPLEINGNGFRKSPISTAEGERLRYPWRPFWELATDYRIKVICNADAHHPEQVLANMCDAQRLAAELGLDVIRSIEKPEADQLQALLP